MKSLTKEPLHALWMPEPLLSHPSRDNPRVADILKLPFVTSEIGEVHFENANLKCQSFTETGHIFISQVMS